MRSAEELRIIVVDDEKEIADLIELYLKNDGYEVVKCLGGAEALKHIREEKFDLAILDVMLPEVDGFTLCSEIRKEHNYPVIMLTARTADSDKISGLVLGADDYVTKPFNPLELTARVKAQLRRFYRYNSPAEEEGIIEISGLEVDERTHTCRLYGRELDLTPTEFGIVSILCKNAGKVVTTRELFESVWGEKYLDSSNTVMVHIRRIREKMHEKSKDPKFIKTVWGVGYKIEKNN
ncbi:MAG: VanR-ABDEGLN family response regulator transcription factor [Oscillospiraceae bacterium]|nr:VanR-ABDEGLN family response regulator transcription factor [Oscillospiraceae bacterium]